MNTFETSDLDIDFKAKPLQKNKKKLVAKASADTLVEHTLSSNKRVSPPVLFHQVLALAPMYGLDIIHSIPALEDNSILNLNFATSSWTINNPESIVLDQSNGDKRDYKTWKAFIQDIKKTWYKKLVEPCGQNECKHILNQLIRVLGYLVKFRVAMVL